MNSHENAGLTPHGRAELVRRVLEEGQRGDRVAEADGLPVSQSRGSNRTIR